MKFSVTSKRLLLASLFITAIGAVVWSSNHATPNDKTADGSRSVTIEDSYRMWYSAHAPQVGEAVPISVCNVYHMPKAIYGADGRDALVVGEAEYGTTKNGCDTATRNTAFVVEDLSKPHTETLLVTLSNGQKYIISKSLYYSRNTPGL